MSDWKKFDVVVPMYRNDNGEGDTIVYIIKHQWGNEILYTTVYEDAYGDTISQTYTASEIDSVYNIKVE